MQNCRIKQVRSTRAEVKPVRLGKPTLNEFIDRHPALSKLDRLKVTLLYQEYLIDYWGEIVADQPELNIWQL